MLLGYCLLQKCGRTDDTIAIWGCNPLSRNVSVM